MASITGPWRDEKCESGEALAKEIGVPLSVLEQTHEVHYQPRRDGEGHRRRLVSRVPIGQVVGRCERQDWLGQEVLPQHLSGSP